MQNLGFLVEIPSIHWRQDAKEKIRKNRLHIGGERGVYKWRVTALGPSVIQSGNLIYSPINDTC